MKKKLAIIFLSVSTIILSLLLVISLAITCFFELPAGPNEPKIIITNDGTRDYALAEFMDHPPWTHSRFFVAEYDYDAKIINLCHYYMLIHPCSKPINTNNIIVLNRLDGKYELRFSGKVLGVITFDNNEVAYEGISN